MTTTGRPDAAPGRTDQPALASSSRRPSRSRSWSGSASSSRSAAKEQFAFDTEWMGEIVEHRSPLWLGPALFFNYAGGGIVGSFVVPRGDLPAPSRVPKAVGCDLLRDGEHPVGRLRADPQADGGPGAADGDPRARRPRFIPVRAYRERGDDGRGARDRLPVRLGVGRRGGVGDPDGGEPHLPRRALAERHDRRAAPRRRGRRSSSGRRWRTGWQRERSGPHPFFLSHAGRALHSAAREAKAAARGAKSA